MSMITEEKNEKMENLDDGVYIIQKGQVTKLNTKPFGQDTLYWNNGEVLHVERSERIRVKN